MAFILPINSVNTIISGESFSPGGVARSLQSGILAGSTEFFESSGNVGIGTSSPSVSFEIARNDSMLVPTGNTSQRPSNRAGQVRFNTTTRNFEGNNGNTWASIGSVPQSVVTVSNSYVMNSSEDLIIGNSSNSITVTLPDASALKSYYFQNSGTGSVVLQAINNQQINGESNLVIQFTNSSCKLVSTGYGFLIF